MPLLSLGDALRLPWRTQVNPLEAQLSAKGVTDLADACRDAGMPAGATLCQEMSSAAARILPHADWSLLVACHAWLVWFVLFDDAMDTSADGAGQGGEQRHLVLFDLLSKGTVPGGGDRLASLGLEVRSRIMAALSPAASARFFQAVEEYMSRGVRPASLRRASQRSPDLASYEAVRVHDIGLAPVMALMEAGLGLELSPAARASAEARKAWHAAARIVAWVNDIVSFDREQQFGDVFNVLLVLMSAGMTPMNARALVDAHIAADVVILEELRKFGARDPSAPPQAYFEALTTLVRGCVDAHEGHERYADDVPGSIAARQLLEESGIFYYKVK